MLRITIFTLMTGLASMSAVADAVYVDDTLRVGVRNSPGTAEAPMEVVTTGAKLEVLESQGHYLRIRTNNGTEGWVSRSYVRNDPPAKVLIDGVSAELARVQLELATLRQETSAATEQQHLAQDVDALRAERDQLQQRLSASVSEDSPKVWLNWAAALLVVFLLGLWLGFGWHKHRVIERLGGFDV